MARLKPTIPLSSGAQGPAAKIADWARIETALQASLSEATRKKIVETTDEFLSAATLERNAAPVSIARDRIREIKSAALALRGAIMNPVAETHRDADVYARHLVNRALRNFPLHKLELRSMGSATLSLARACNAALRFLERVPYENFRPGEAWDWWVRQLRAILKSDALPSGVRKDAYTRIRKQHSPFVLFVHELQQCIPAEFRRSIQSPAALAVAINKAGRREPKQRKLKRL